MDDDGVEQEGSANSAGPGRGHVIDAAFQLVETQPLPLPLAKKRLLLIRHQREEDYH